MVKGLIINKFRGDKSILDPGIRMLEERAQIPVVGVAPYMRLELDDEDSLTERFEGSQEVKQVDIAVIRVPRISNFTDFNPFEMMEGVSLRYVKHVGELKHPDMILLPGTKNTMEDLLWMRQNGLEAAIQKEAKAGAVIFGICGGYQMLGERLSDPEGVEAGGEIRGMGLLPMETVFAGSKTRTRVTGSFCATEGVFSSLAGVELEGYEIHMGVSTRKEGCSGLTLLDSQLEDGQRQKLDGACSGQVFGSYVHGIFDREQVAKGIVMALGAKKGIDMSQAAAVDFTAFKETQYDLLAQGLRESLDLKKIYEILEQGV